MKIDSASQVPACKDPPPVDRNYIRVKNFLKFV